MHEAHTTEGDTVNIVGGGYGISTTVALCQVGDTGLVRAYEPSPERRNWIHETITTNGVSTASYEIVPARVGGTEFRGKNRRYRECFPENVPVKHPAELPECDVLELDCEGAELEILQHLAVSPRIIIVEIHPDLLSEPPSEVVSELHELGYEITQYMIHDGVEITEETFLSLLEDDDRTTEDDIPEFPNKMVRPPVVCAKRVENQKRQT